MLEAVQRVLGLVGRHAHPRLDVDIVVVTLDVGVGVVDKIMLGIPHVRATAKHTQRVGSQSVHPSETREAAVGTVVHHIKANGGNN